MLNVDLDQVNGNVNNITLSFKNREGKDCLNLS